VGRPILSAGETNVPQQRHIAIRSSPVRRPDDHPGNRQRCGRRGHDLAPGPSVHRTYRGEAPAPDLALDRLVADHRCLAEALYYEARGEGRSGQQAVAEVVFHRMNTGNFGHSICAVVYEGAAHRGCQFSFTCDGALHRPREAEAWKKSEELAAQISHPRNAAAQRHRRRHQLSRRVGEPLLGPTLKKTTQIGHHIFYRSHG